MKKLNSRLMVIFIVFSLFLGGCATTQNLIRTEKYDVSISSSSPDTYFTQIKATEDMGHFKVSGKLNFRNRGGHGHHIPHFVEVALLDQNGSVIDSKKVSYDPGHFTRSGKRKALFSALFSEIPPQGTTIRLSNIN